MRKYDKTMLFIFIYILLCISCESQKNKLANLENVISDTTLINITVDPENGKAVPFDSLIDNISFIRLQTTDECLIGEVDQILCTNEFIYILDAFVSNAVYCFNKQGHYMRRIGNVGEGPSEYTRLCNIALTDDEKQIVLYDWSGKLHYYNLYGVPQKDETLKFIFDNIEFTGNSIIGFYDHGSIDKDRCMLSVLNQQKENTYKAFPSYQTKTFTTSPTPWPLRRFGKQIYLNDPWTNSFYLIGEYQSQEIYRINIIDGGYPEITPDIDYGTFKRIKENRICVEDFVILKNSAIFYFWKKNIGWSPFILYSHKTKQTYKCSGAHSNPLFPFQSPFNVPLVRYNDETFMVAQTAVDVLRQKNNIYSNCPTSNNAYLSQLYDGLTEDSNPVLFLFHTKP